MSKNKHMNEEHEETPLINADENQAGTTHLSEEIHEGGTGEEDKLRQELADQKDKYLRLVADFDNARKRTAKERSELILNAGKDVIHSLLEVLDDMDRAERVMDSGADTEQVAEGVKLVFKKLRNTLEQRGLKALSSVGEEFDTDLHEAISQIPAPSEDAKGKVMDEVQKGYKLNDTILRHAKVVVGS